MLVSESLLRFTVVVWILLSPLHGETMGGKVLSKKPQSLHPYKESRVVELNPAVQNIPLNESLKHLRPPKPIPLVAGEFSIFIGLSVFRDGYRCGKTIFTGFKRAAYPEKLRFGVVDQVLKTDMTCLEAYCAFAREEWPDETTGGAKNDEFCKYRDQITFDEHDADESRGPTLARHYQQKLVREEDFCLQLDGHSIFTNNWDVNLHENWVETDNEMAVLSTYLHDLHDFVQENGDNKPPTGLPFLCKTMRGGRNLVRNEGASIIRNFEHPQLAALWGAGLSFSKCHAEKRVPIDPYTLWMFDGEEFLRSSHLWTYGYDIYAPSQLGAVVYHNYSKVPARFERVSIDANRKKKEGDMAANRFRLLVGVPFKGEVDTNEIDVYGWGKVRSFESYLNFSGVTFKADEKDTDTCHQLHWVPYENPQEVEDLVPGYKMWKEIIPSKEPVPQRPKRLRMEDKHTVENEIKGHISGTNTANDRDGEHTKMNIGEGNTVRHTQNSILVFVILAMGIVLSVLLYGNDAWRVRVMLFLRGKKTGTTGKRAT